jgi:hypothetical protein
MRTIKLVVLFFLLVIMQSIKCNSQETSFTTNKIIKTIHDIPHKSIREKWMWIHRSVVFIITKERPVNWDTTYIKSFFKKLVITIRISSRFLQFSLIDFKSGNKLTFAPN